MGSNNYSSNHCYNIMEVQNIRNNITLDDWIFLMKVCGNVDGNEDSHKYSKPKVWIGFYIAIASLFCILAMVADLLHGFRNRKTWFPCKYFCLNAASITVIAVAMKLTVDMSIPMPGDMDQATKLGSMAFLCTMMANLMPSLASMDNKTLLVNVIGLAILVITMIVNVFIEINTGVINHEDYIQTPSFGKYYFIPVAYIYMAMILFLLTIIISCAITIPTTKKILEFKYQAITKTDLNDQYLEHTTFNRLKQYVKRYWVMVETSSPQFVMASNPLSFASSTICLFCILINTFLFLELLQHRRFFNCQSDYKLSIGAIYITQFIGVVVGSIAPIIRCFTVLRFDLIPNSYRNPFMDFKVEKFWTQKLCDWKENQIPFLSRGRRSRNLVHNLKNLILSICIRFQKIIVVSCKMIQLILIVIIIIFVYCSYYGESLKEMLCTTPTDSTNNDTSEDLSNYVLQLQGETGFAEKTIKSISNSMYRVIQKAENEQYNNLLKLLENSTGFGGVESFDSDQVQPLFSVELSNNWSLPIMNLTGIAIALPNIHKDKKDSLFKSVGESLLYTHLVEESLNCASEYVNIHRASTSLWHEVEDNCKWLENTLKRNAYNGKTSVEILKWFADKAKEIVIETKRSANKEQVENFPNKLISANSMYRIAQTILVNYQSKIELVTEEELFDLLHGMIADIVVACFTNIPRVITTKCGESVIEKREDSMEAAAKLLGSTTKIINKLEAHDLPNMDPDKMAFIDEWCIHMKKSIP